jgi:hypothetical protein
VLWVASAISALFLLLYPQMTIHPALSFWFYLFLHPFPPLPQLILAPLAIDKSLIMPVWTIFIELIGSTIMPILVSIALTRARLFSYIVVGMVLRPICWFMHHTAWILFRTCPTLHWECGCRREDGHLLLASRCRRFSVPPSP